MSCHVPINQDGWTPETEIGGKKLQQPFLTTPGSISLPEATPSIRWNRSAARAATWAAGDPTVLKWRRTHLLTKNRRKSGRKSMVGRVAQLGLPHVLAQLCGGLLHQVSHRLAMIPGGDKINNARYPLH